MPLFTDERNSKVKLVVNFISSKFGSLPHGVLKVRITKPCTHLHPAPSTSTQLHPPPPSSIHIHPAHFNLHRAPSTSTQLISVSTQLSATPSTIFEPKYHKYLGNFPKFRPKNSKLSILIENRLTRYVGGADFESRPPKSIFGLIWAQNVKVVRFV